jgi:hypothetical protein
MFSATIQQRALGQSVELMGDLVAHPAIGVFRLPLKYATYL